MEGKGSYIVSTTLIDGTGRNRIEMKPIDWVNIDEYRDGELVNSESIPVSEAVALTEERLAKGWTKHGDMKAVS